MALVASALQVFVGGVILIRVGYRSGIDAQPSEVGAAPVVYDSPHGGGMCAFCLLSGAIAFALEARTFMRSTPLVMPWLWPTRAALYLALALPGLITSASLMPPVIGSAFYLVTSIACVVACCARKPTAEEWRWAWFYDRRKEKEAEEAGGKYESFAQFALRLPCTLFTETFEKGQLPRALFLLVYSLANLVLFIEAMLRHQRSENGKALRGEPFLACGDPLEPCAHGDDASGVPVGANEMLQQASTGTWFPVAKGFGQLLNFNCAFLILPVVHSLVRWLHDVTSTSKSWSVKWVRYVLPLDKSVVFHKACAKYFVCGATIGHVGAHYLNYSDAPLYADAFGSDYYDRSPTTMAWHPTAPSNGLLNAGFTGELLLLTMLLIYAGAHEQVRRSHYETFWYTHHFFVLFFVLLLFHSQVWKWWCLPALVPYVLDRLHRVFLRGSRRMALARIYFWGKPERPDVVTLQFDNTFSDPRLQPMKYMEGHYLYLRCPAVETSRWAPLKEWHPFTISSAPDEPVLEVNLRVMPSTSSWTHKVAQYLRLLDPNGTGEVELAKRNPFTGAPVLGKISGPDNKPFFFVDGPHGAPSQHVFNYETSVLIGAGIGVTPCASIMKGVVNYRWKKGFSPQNLHFYWIARWADLAKFKWLLLTLPELKASQLQHNEYYGDEEARRQQLVNRLRQLGEEVAQGRTHQGSSEPMLPEGWAQARAQGGQLYYYHTRTGETSWQPPTVGSGCSSGGGRGGAHVGVRAVGGGGSSLVPAESSFVRSDSVASMAARRKEMAALQARLREMGSHHRSLSITLYLTGCKAEQVVAQAHPTAGSTEELVAALLSTTDPNTGRPYLELRAGRPDWFRELGVLSDMYGRADVGVVFCGSKPIAKALKQACEARSQIGGTMFTLHKENF